MHKCFIKSDIQISKKKNFEPNYEPKINSKITVRKALFIIINGRILRLKAG